LVRGTASVASSAPAATRSASNAFTPHTPVAEPGRMIISSALETVEQESAERQRPALAQACRSRSVTGSSVLVGRGGAARLTRSL
jgi:hypothetical protein